MSVVTMPHNSVHKYNKYSLRFSYVRNTNNDMLSFLKMKANLNINSSMLSNVGIKLDFLPCRINTAT